MGAPKPGIFKVCKVSCCAPCLLLLSVYSRRICIHEQLKSTVRIKKILPLSLLSTSLTILLTSATTWHSFSDETTPMNIKHSQNGFLRVATSPSRHRVHLDAMLTSVNWPETNNFLFASKIDLIQFLHIFVVMFSFHSLRSKTTIGSWFALKLYEPTIRYPL